VAVARKPHVVGVPVQLAVVGVALVQRADHVARLAERRDGLPDLARAVLERTRPSNRSKPPATQRSRAR
jgi:hypothetical protein